MPVMNGLEAARAMSAESPKCALLMYTMFAAPQLIELACTEKWAEEHSHFRSPKCLYLWKCGHRKISIL